MRQPIARGNTIHKHPGQFHLLNSIINYVYPTISMYLDFMENSYNILSSYSKLLTTY